MKKLFYIVICTAIFLSIGACTDESSKISDVVIFVEPKIDSVFEISSGEKIRYKLKISTIHESINRFSVKSFDLYNGYIIHLDSTCVRKQKSFTYDFVYTAPEIDRDELNIEFTFIVEDNKGNIAENKRTLRVKNKLISLMEKSGIVLYSSLSDYPNSLNLNDVSQPFVLKYSPDSLNADIYIETAEDFECVNIRSLTKAKFVRNNSFNYSTATAKQIQAVYESSVRSDVILDLCINDIFLVGHDKTAEGVFHVKNIISKDVLGDNVCVQLGYKGVKRIN